MNFKAFKNKLKSKRRLRHYLEPIFGCYRNAQLRFLRLRYGIDPQLCAFSAFDCRSYSDSPRYVSEALHALCPTAKIVWLFRDPQAARAQFPIPAYVACLQGVSREGLKAQACARVIVDNFNKRKYLRMDYKRQVYLQTWHGDRAFKKIGYDADFKYSNYIETNCDAATVGSDYGERQFRSAFHYNGKLLKVGLPRNDLLLNGDADTARVARERLKIADDTRILLYAPTYRDDDRSAHQTQRIPLDLARALDALQARDDVRWVCLVRAHYLSYGIPVGGDARIRCVSDYPEMAELLLISDALLTDYSSCAGDFALTGRPIFLYQNDLDDYLKNSRKLYFDMKDSPYWVARTPDELDTIINECTAERAEENDRAILAFYNTYESGHAARSTAEYIIGKLGPTKGQQA